MADRSADTAVTCGLLIGYILAATLARIRTEGITGTVYTHPIGDHGHGHGAGPLIGRWVAQEGVPVRGDAGDT